MTNPVITNNDNLQLPVFDPKFEDGTLSFIGAATWALGVIMAKALVAAGAVTADAGNTGDGTVTGFALAPGGPPLPGDWNLECTFAVTNGGVFKLEDPNGEIVADNLTLRVGAGLATSFSIAGIQFIVTDGATDFIAGDKFALAVTDLESVWRPWVEDALDGTGEAKGILPYEKVATGSGDVYGRVLVGGEVSYLKLSVQAGGTVPQKVLDQLRNFTIHDIKGVRIDILDNQ